MQKTIIVQIGEVLTTINTNLKQLDNGQYSISLSFKGKVTSVNVLEPKGNQQGMKKTSTKGKFTCNEKLHSYLVAFNDGLEFAGLN